MTDWYVTLWQEGQGWHYRIERGQERQVMGQGGAYGAVTREFVREYVWNEYRRLRNLAKAPVQ